MKSTPPQDAIFAALADDTDGAEVMPSMSSVTAPMARLQQIKLPACEIAAERGRFIKIPNYLVGLVLDRGTHRSEALFLLAVLLAAWPGFSLNDRFFRKHYGIGWRAFQAALRQLRFSGAICRQQRGRAFAVDTITAGGGGFVMLPRSLIAKSSPEQRSAERIDGAPIDQATLASFVLVTDMMGSDPVPVAEIGDRLGIKSRTTLRAVSRRANDLRHIDLGMIGGEMHAGRVGSLAKIGVTKNGVTKSGVAKDGAAHLRRKELTRDEKSIKSEGRVRPASDRAFGPIERGPGTAEQVARRAIGRGAEFEVVSALALPLLGMPAGKQSLDDVSYLVEVSSTLASRGLIKPEVLDRLSETLRCGVLSWRPDPGEVGKAAFRIETEPEWALRDDIELSTRFVWDKESSFERTDRAVKKARAILGARS